MLSCHSFAVVLAYMCITVEITQPSKHKVVIRVGETGLQMSDQHSECVSSGETVLLFK